MVMLCPYCGKEMEKGFIQCRDGVWWSEKKRPVSALHIFGGNMVDLAKSLPGVAGDRRAADAYLCRDCRKVVVDYIG